MAVEENDFRDLFTGNLALTPQAQHVLRVFTFVRVPHAGLAGKERLKPFALEVIKEGDGGNTGIPLALQIHAVFGLATLTRGERYNNCRELERLGNILPAEAEKAY